MPKRRPDRRLLSSKVMAMRHWSESEAAAECFEQPTITMEDLPALGHAGGLSDLYQAPGSVNRGVPVQRDEIFESYADRKRRRADERAAKEAEAEKQRRYRERLRRVAEAKVRVDRARTMCRRADKTRAGALLRRRFEDDQRQRFNEFRGGDNPAAWIGQRVFWGDVPFLVAGVNEPYILLANAVTKTICNQAVPDLLEWPDMA